MKASLLLNPFLSYYRSRKISFYSYLGIVLMICVSKIIIVWSGASHPLATNSALHWSNILIILGIGFLLMVFAPYGGIERSPDAYKKINGYLYVPMLLGIAFGMYEIVMSLILKYPNFHVPFPLSVPVYLSGGTLYEIKYHLIPITAASILLVRIFNQRYATLIFWILALALSVYEPYKQVSSMIDWKIISGTFWIAETAVGIFIANIIPFYFLKKHGFVSMLVMRLTTYVIWHIIWPPLYF
ncbi:MAG: hypothetical protein JXR71_13100 [Bacteroidales bacterium]|nr:hypothetical protein [Bacteroidales bacterium]